uniref:Putative secreted protein n=1 Tax=Corethrella appendiculata TaxID=1370023 RepID=U5EP73_9DIPT
MKRIQTILFLLIISLISYGNCVNKIKGSTNIDQLRHSYLETVEKPAWNLVNQIQDNDNNEISKLNEQRLNILEKIIELYSDFALKTLNTKYKYDEFDYLILKRFYEWQLLEKDLISIHTLFDAFRQYLQHQHSISMNDMDFELASIDIAETVLKDPHWPTNDTLKQIETIMLKQGLYYKAVTEAKSTICTYRQSAQQILYQLYNAVSITELKGYSMMQFSWMLLKTYGKGNFTKESELMRNNFEDRIEKTQAILQKVMERSDRDIWRCDPNKFIENENYLQITRLLQGYIENEVDMNSDSTCRENCGAYPVADIHGCYQDLYCAKQPKCTGKLYDCMYEDSDMWICPASSKSNRRYEYIEYENGKVFGNKKDANYCPRGTTKVDSWWRWLFWHCSYCFCLCDMQGELSDRYINMREYVSDIQNNRVVTGIRFVKRNRIIHLQVQQGELLPRGMINLSTLEWVNVSDYRLLDRNIRNDIDYHTLTRDSRTLDLDDITAPDSHVVTGVRFRLLGSNLNLEVRITEIDFAQGLLINKATSVWLSNDATEASHQKRTEVKLVRPNIPTKSISASLPNSEPNQYIKFQASDRETDASQTTVPFIDSQPCTSITPTPLSGVGLMHKGLKLYGGFITPKIITYNLTPHIQKPEPANK